MKVHRGRLALLGGGLLSLVLSASPGAQQFLDRVVARVNGVAITLSDVNAAVGLGLVAGDAATAIGQVVDRQLVLTEMARFSPPEPADAAVDREVAAMKARVGGALQGMMDSTGLDEARVRDLIRDTLRIQTYLDQRFGASVQVSDDEADRYYREHPAEFSRDGVLMPFETAAPVARQRAADARRRAVIAQWLSDLRGRADVTILPARSAGSPAS